MASGSIGTSMNLVRRTSKRDYLLREQKYWSSLASPVRRRKLTPEDLASLNEARAMKLDNLRGKRKPGIS